MLDPISALAFEVQISKGVFALLLGSGVSRSSKIPTGWEITLDLVRKVAALRGIHDLSDPAAWYAATFGKSPDYSELLDTLATTPAQRRQFIAPYIEPNDEERERGDKTPTAAHRAIATLMAKKYVKVVVTTNFDRLLEIALTDLGAHATVLSSEDHIAGAVPLVHAGPTIIKVHGDYLDTRIRNTADELSTYEPETDRFLNRVFDEFGLIVCGWSADWDVALKAAIDRAPSRRYPTYWAARGAASPAAQALIDRRSGRLVPITGADQFFAELEQKVQALETLNRPHPLSAEMAVAMLKEYLSEPRHAIRLHDFIAGELDRVIAALNGPQFKSNDDGWEAFAKQAQEYPVVLDTLLRLAYVAGRWSTAEQTGQWVDVVLELALRSNRVTGPTISVDLMSYPASLVLYAFGLGAIVGQRPDNIGTMARRKADFRLRGKLALTDRLNIATLIADGSLDAFKTIPKYSRTRLASSECVADVLRPIARGDLRTPAAFDEAFARLELSLAFGYVEREFNPENDFWAPPGLYVFNPSLMKAILDEWREDEAISSSKGQLTMMASLAAPPRFDDVQAFAGKLRRKL